MSRVGDDGDGIESALALGNGFEDRDALGASVRPKVAFSTLQPVKMRPDFARTAAPTRKLEKGACACSRAVRAAAISVSIESAGWSDCSTAASMWGFDGIAVAPACGSRDSFCAAHRKIASMRGITARSSATKSAFTRSPVSITSSVVIG